MNVLTKPLKVNFNDFGSKIDYNDISCKKTLTHI